MRYRYRPLPATLAIALVAACSSASAAPLDALLTATPGGAQTRAEVEVGYDMMNTSLDFLHLREKSGSANTSASSGMGNYQGGHLHAGAALTPRLWVDATYMKRKIDYRSFDAAIDSWQLGAQYKVLDGAGSAPTVALRVAAWGNEASSLTKYTNTTVAGTKFTSATVTQPKDRQLQFDVIGTWPVAEHIELTGSVGAGAGRVTFGAVSATSRTRNGCEYNIAFDEASATGTLAHPCNASVVIDRFVYPAADNVDVYKEARYRSSNAHAGLMARWHSANWQVRAGYQYQSIRRSDVDDIIERRGATAYKHNQVLISDVSYDVSKNVTVFLRGQYMSNQFNGEIPMAYNSLTAEKFSQKYGIVSTGLVLKF